MAIKQATQPIIILSGPVGAGKSTVAKQLVAAMDGPVTYIEGDTFWSFIAKGAPSRPRSKDFKIIMAAITAAAVPYAMAGYQVVLDFSIPPWFLPTAQRIVKLKEIPLHYVVLRPSEVVCATRSATRKEGAIDDYTAYREFYNSFSEAEKYTISDDTAAAATLAQLILKKIEAGVLRVWSLPEAGAKK